MRKCLPLTIFALAIVLSAGPVAAAEHHLYVASILDYGSPSVGLERFRLVDGKPQRNPDLIYPSASGPIAIAPDGSLYAQDNIYPDYLDRFAAGSIRRESRLVVAPCRHGYLYGGLSGMAFDAAGDAYTAFTEGVSGLEAFNPRGCGAQTIAIYPAGAKRHSRALHVFALPGGASDAGLRLAVRASGTLAVTDMDENAVRIYAEPMTQRRPTRIFYGSAVQQPQGLAFDPPAHVVYVSMSGTTQQEVGVFPDNAQGNVDPVRVIVDPSAQFFCGQVALFGPYLFVSDGETFTVNTYRKDASGAVTPVASISLPFQPCGVAVD